MILLLSPAVATEGTRRKSRRARLVRTTSGLARLVRATFMAVNGSRRRRPALPGAPPAVSRAGGARERSGGHARPEARGAGQSGGRQAEPERTSDAASPSGDASHRTGCTRTRHAGRPRPARAARDRSGEPSPRPVSRGTEPRPCRRCPASRPGVLLRRSTTPRCAARRGGGARPAERRRARWSSARRSPASRSRASCAASGSSVTHRRARALACCPRAAHPACAEVVERRLRARGHDLRLGVSASAVERHDGACG